MKDHELYRRILGIEAPWQVDWVDLKLEAGEVHVRLAHRDRMGWPCPECGASCQLHDHQPERQWRHLDTCQYRTILHAAPPRSECPEHGVRVVKLPWAEPSSRFTALFEALAIEWLKAASQKAVAGLLRLSWDEIHGIMERAVKRGLERRQAEPVTQLGVDEKAFRKGHHYLTLVNDLARGRVLYVAQDRKQSSLGRVLGDPDAGANRRGRGGGHGHVESLHRLGAGAPAGSGRQDRLRQVSHRPASGRRGGQSAPQGEQDPARGRRRHAGGNAPMTGCGIRHRMEPKDRRAFAALRDSGLKTARAWALKETMMAFFDYRYERPARKHFRWWHNWAVRSRLQPMIEVGRMLKRRFANIVTYLRHRVTNATSESLNAKIQWVKYTARGFRNKQNFVNAIYFHCGGLNLAP